MRLPIGIGLLLSLATVSTLSGCASVCDEVADEAEASGCATGELPDACVDGECESTLCEGEQAVTQDLAVCEGVREMRAQCFLEFTQNVCSISDSESEGLKQCFAAACGSIAQ